MLHRSKPKRFSLLIGLDYYIMFSLSSGFIENISKYNCLKMVKRRYLRTIMPQTTSVFEFNTQYFLNYTILSGNDFAKLVIRANPPSIVHRSVVLYVLYYGHTIITVRQSAKLISENT